MHRPCRRGRGSCGWEAYACLALLVLRIHYHPFIFCLAKTWNDQNIWCFISVKSQPTQKEQHTQWFVSGLNQSSFFISYRLLRFSHLGNALLDFKFLSKWHSLASNLSPRMPLGPGSRGKKIMEGGSPVLHLQVSYLSRPETETK